MPKNFTTIIIVSLIVLVGIVLIGKGLGKSHLSTQVDQLQTAMRNDQGATPMTASSSASASAQLKIEDLIVGTGTQATPRHQVTVNYVGTLPDGTKFDSSYDRNQPFIFNLGGGEVIKGWDQGVVGMKVGGKRRLTIPPELGYGAQGAGSTIPPNSTLIFEVELLGVQ